MFRTNKCNHGDKGMCIHCLINKNKQSTTQQPKNQGTVIKCQHPPHMKCLKCLPKDASKQICQHQDYEKCKNCQHLIRYEKFQHYLESLRSDCKHQKPCKKCVPPLSRKHYFIDKECKKHIPYPQGQCDACMAPTLTIAKQNYAHIRKVIIRTTAIYRIAQAELFGILLGRIEDDVVIVQNVYFPSEQEPGSAYVNPWNIDTYSHIWQYFGLREVGVLYHSNEITGLGLMISSLFQQRYLQFVEENQISKFITMRLQLQTLQGTDPHFQCFMVSDQLQAFHKNGIIHQSQKYGDRFDLITAKASHLSEMPTFLREGVETDKMFFKQALVWIDTVSEESFQYEQYLPQYPFFTLDHQDIENFRQFIMLEIEPLQKYRNIQFLLHLQKLIGRQTMLWFINNYLVFDPDLFLRQRLPLIQNIQKEKLKNFEKKM